MKLAKRDRRDARDVRALDFFGSLGLEYRRHPDFSPYRLRGPLIDMLRPCSAIPGALKAFKPTYTLSSELPAARFLSRSSTRAYTSSRCSNAALRLPDLRQCTSLGTTSQSSALQGRCSWQSSRRISGHTARPFSTTPIPNKYKTVEEARSRYKSGVCVYSNISI